MNDLDTPKPNAGRPRSMTHEVLRQLETYLAKGATVRQACALVGICRKTYHRYATAHPDWSEEIDALRGTLRYRAEMVIHEAIEEEQSVSVAQWYLKHRHSKEYNTKGDADTTQSPTTDDLRTLLDKLQADTQKKEELPG